LMPTETRGVDSSAPKTQHAAAIFPQTSKASHFRRRQIDIFSSLP
jgi:hypothetical protein